MKSVVKRILLFILCLGIICVPITYLKADSGWDTDYDSGGWSSSDSGWSSSDSDWSSSSSNSGDLTFGEFIVVAVIIVTVIVVSIIIEQNKKKNGGSLHTYSNTNSNFRGVPMGTGLSQEDIDALDNTINKSEIVNKTFDIYRDVQYAWSQFDYEKLESLLSDELYNNYKMQLETLKMKNQKNLMEDITFKNGYLKAINFDGDTEYAVMSLTITMKDYVIDMNTNNVVRGNDQVTIEVTYEITLVRTKGKHLNNCPGCGAPVSDTSRERCEYCDSVIVSNNTDFVMSKKECINQRRV